MLVVCEVAVLSSEALSQMQAVCTTIKLVAGGNTRFVDPTTTTNDPGPDKDMDISEDNTASQLTGSSGLLSAPCPSMHEGTSGLGSTGGSTQQETP